MLLLVDHQQCQILELYGLAEQGMGADHDIDRAIGETRPHLCKLRGRNEPRGLRYVHREAAKPLRERLEVLARQQCRWYDHSHLLATDRRKEGCAQSDLGLAEADVAANETVHRTSRSKVLDRCVDGRELIIGFLIGKARAELVISTRADRQTRRFPQLSFRGNLDQLTRDFADTALHPRFARLPVAAAETVEVDGCLLRAVARQQINVLNRQIKLGALRVMNLQTIVGSAGSLDRLQSRKATYAVVDVHYEIAWREAGRLGDEILRTPGSAPGPYQPVAKNILLADDRGFIGLKTGFDTEYRKRNRGPR